MLLVAGVVDGISGGGGLIALPAYLAAGLPVTNAYGCNKLQSCLGTSASLAKYASHKMIDIKTALPAAAASILGATIATNIMLMLDDAVKRIIIAVSMLFVIVLTVLSGRMKVENCTLQRARLTSKTLFLCLAAGLLLGLYDGFFGPGGGTVALLLFAILMRYDLRVGCGNGKLIIVIANLTSVIMYIIDGSILYYIALPCSAANIIGSYVGATLATKNGAKFVKYVSWLVIAALLVYAVIQIFK